jgi:Toprim-like/Protein of unknown function (DUF3991)
MRRLIVVGFCLMLSCPPGFAEDNRDHLFVCRSPVLAFNFWEALQSIQRQGVTLTPKIKMDRHSNAVFPHFDSQGLCGYELRNAGFKGFASGGAKGLWLSKTISADRRLVICESSIDAISFAVVFPDGHARYASIGGKLSPAQPDLIRAQIDLLPPGGEIVAAMDADDAGRQLAEAIEKSFSATGRADLTFRRQEPKDFIDWNDLLRATRGPSLVSPSQPEARPA